MNQSREAAKLQHIPAKVSPIDISFPSLQELVDVDQRLQHGTLAGAVGAEQQREWRELDALSSCHAFEVLELERLRRDGALPKLSEKAR